jgi:hypothetical protein
LIFDGFGEDVFGGFCPGDEAADGVDEVALVLVAAAADVFGSCLSSVAVAFARASPSISRRPSSS